MTHFFFKGPTAVSLFSFQRAKYTLDTKYPNNECQQIICWPTHLSSGKESKITLTPFICQAFFLTFIKIVFA
jgi:hypothetical protein